MDYSDAFEDAFAEVIGHEGGYTTRRSDHGNWTGGEVGVGKLKGTKYGIAAHSYPNLDIKNLTLADARSIYWHDYWVKSGALLCHPGLSYAVFDAGVNTGNSRSRKWLQKAVGTTADGQIGPKSREAIALSEPKATLKEFMAQRTWHHMKLDSMDDEYGLGWSRRIIEVTMTAITMIGDFQSKK